MVLPFSFIRVQNQRFCGPHFLGAFQGCQIALIGFSLCCRQLFFRRKVKTFSFVAPINGQYRRCPVCGLVRPIKTVSARKPVAGNKTRPRRFRSSQVPVFAGFMIRRLVSRWSKAIFGQMVKCPGFKERFFCLSRSCPQG